MGEEITKSSRPTIEEVGREEDRRGNTGSGSSTNTETKERVGGGHTGGTRGTRGTTEEEKKKLPRLSSLDRKEGETEEQYKKRLERNEKKRLKYQEQKAKGTVQQAKPKKVNKKKQEEVNTEQLNVFIKTLSTLVASRKGFEHWQLTDKEIESITTPLAKMLQENEIFEKLGEHSNQIALITACVTVFVPRIITTTLLIKEKKKYEQSSKQPKQPSNQGKVVDISKQDDRQTTTNSKAVSDDEHWFNSIVY